MRDAGQGSNRYRPFPAFAEWDTGSINTSDFERYSQLLKSAKETATTESLEEALSAATRYAAVDTGAIEGLYAVDRGFTRTIATQAAAWEAVMESRGQHVRPAFEDAMRAYEYVFDAATRAVGVSEKWIKELHMIICQSQETYTVYTPSGPQEHDLPKGVYKKMPNSPTLSDGRQHEYAPVLETVPEMRRLTGELRAREFQNAHPVVQAAYAHYAYVCVHPFSDGNGRVARALASVYLYRSPGLPLIVFADQRNDYYDALESADNGNPYPFLQFVSTRTIDGIGIIRSMLNRSGRSISSTVLDLHELFNPNAPDDDLHAATIRLRNLAVGEAKKQLESLSLPPQLDTLANAGHIAQVPPPEGYGGVGKDGSWYLQVTSGWPHEIRALVYVAAFARIGDVAPSDMFMAASPATRSSKFDAPTDGLEIGLRELVPVTTESFKLKLAAWVEGRIAELLAETARQATDQGCN